ncbi:hypothetical protein BT93_F2779 [Corymbia citriodora subsp. variegata]|nr:hypothetical protein BT93_F2779 [Corymbia citriodora subsp. variegata]
MPAAWHGWWVSIFLLPVWLWSRLDYRLVGAPRNFLGSAPQGIARKMNCSLGKAKEKRRVLLGN